MPRRPMTATVAATLLLLGACTSGDGTPAAAPTTTPAPATTTPTPTPAPTTPQAKAGPTNPLTGRPGVPRGPVIVTKIDNTANGKPQFGLESADVVYVEEVEAGQTRVVGVFASRYPTQVGPMRSVRSSDPELLGAYGNAALAFSGGAGGPVAALHRSKLIDLSPGRGQYYRIGSRPAPYNLMTNLDRMARTSAARAARPKDVGFRFADTLPALATARKVTRVSAVIGTTRLYFAYEPRSRRWLQTTASGGYVRSASGAVLGAPNLIVQICRVGIDRGNVDVNGSPSKFTYTVGSGTVAIFRDGRVLIGKWSRPRAGGQVRFLDGAKKDIPLRTGGSWVLLQGAGNALSYR